MALSDGTATASDSGSEHIRPAVASKARRWLRPIIGALGYGIIVLLVWRAIDREHFLAGLTRLTPGDIVAVFVVAILHVSGRAYRFHRLLLRTSPTNYRWTDGVRIFLVGLSASAVTPARAGDLIKARLVKPYGVGLNAGLGLVMVERMLDLLVIVPSIVGAGAALSNQRGSAGWRGAALVLLLGLVAGGVIVSVKRLRAVLLRGAAALIVKLRPSTGTPAAVEAHLNGAFGVWDAIFVSPRTFVAYWSFSAAAWAFDFAKLWLVLRFIGVAVAPTIVLFVYPVSIMAGVLAMLPFSEGVVGVTGIALLGAMAGLDSGAATVGVVIDRAASNVLPLILWGLFAVFGGSIEKRAAAVAAKTAPPS